jgi:hypothetical protein
MKSEMRLAAGGLACAVVHETEGVFVAAGRIDFPGGEEVGVLRAQQFVIG